ncbi:MAG TPA: exodeoxyribonuclease III [Kofleriaceae bacterium]|nr:exodeoxyribonuclease III [Kofleriaceae bacterium]
MKLATWNVNSIRMRQARLIAWIDRQQPDVLCMQETKVEDDRFPLELFRERGYQVALHGQKTYNGVAIASRLPMTDVVCGLPAEGGGVDEQARLVAAAVAGVRVVCAYVPNGQAPGTPKYEHKLGWMERLRLHLGATCDPAAPFALCGDFNVAPDDRDVHDPVAWNGQIMCSEPERAALRAIAAIGLVDGLRQLRADGGLFTWWDYRQLAFPRNHGLRIDHLLLTAPLAARLREVAIDRDERKGKQPSDHAPVIATFDP